MRKVIALFMLPLIMLSSCNYNSDDKIAKEEYLTIINNILEENDEELKKIFAYNVSSKIANFDNQIIELINYVSGTYISSKYTGTGAEYTIDGFKEVRFLPMVACELYTSDSKYYFSLLYCNIDDNDDKNIGVWNLMVQKCGNNDETFEPYSSYDEWINSDKYRGITLI